MKRFVVKKYIMAKSASDALRKERMIKPDDVWVDEKQPEQSQMDAIGFDLDISSVYYSEYMKKHKPQKRNVKKIN